MEQFIKVKTQQEQKCQKLEMQVKNATNFNRDLSLIVVGYAISRLTHCIINDDCDKTTRSSCFTCQKIRTSSTINAVYICREISFCDYEHLEMEVPNLSNDDYTGDNPGRILINDDDVSEVRIMSYWIDHPDCLMKKEEFCKLNFEFFHSKFYD